MNNHKQRESRNLGVTVLAGTFALLAGLIAWDSLPSDGADTGQIITFWTAVAVAIVALLVAVYGRVRLFKQLVDAIFNYPA